MVSRGKRDEARQLIAKLLAGEISNDDFDNAYPDDRMDPALGAIYDRLWFFWDARYTHTLTGRHSLTDEAKVLFERCIAFLDSDLEYRWPPRIFAAGFSLLLLRAFRFRKKAEAVERAQTESLRSIGDVDVWPFLNQTEYVSVTNGNPS